MTIARRTGDAGKADRLFSLIVRSRGRCEYPGCGSQGPYDTAHLIGRALSGTRCLEDNAVCACRTHHRLIDNWWDEKALIISVTIGADRYQELRAIAEAHKHRPVTSVMFWRGEVARLTARCAELNIDTRRAS